MFRDFVSLFVLPDEDEKELSILEQGVRKTIDVSGIYSLIYVSGFDIFMILVWAYWGINN